MNGYDLDAIRSVFNVQGRLGDDVPPPTSEFGGDPPYPVDMSASDKLRAPYQTNPADPNSGVGLELEGR